MCRMTLFNHAGKNYIDHKMGLTTYFQWLENRQGGHGNGVAILDKTGNTIVHKGVSVTPAECAKFVRMTHGTWYLFHTRMASAGEVSDVNCHPFQFEEGVVAMNGTLSAFRGLGELLGDRTDTEALLHTLRALKLPIPAALSSFDAAWLGIWKGVPFVINSGYHDMEYFGAKKSIIFASEFPISWNDIYHVRPGTYWHGGKIPADALDPRGYHSQSYSTYEDSYYDPYEYLLKDTKKASSVSSKDKEKEREDVYKLIKDYDQRRKEIVFSSNPEKKTYEPWENPPPRARDRAWVQARIEWEKTKERAKARLTEPKDEDIEVEGILEE